jgi:prepilin-type N-terminal cleavage/methylation domain-containing protein
MMKTRKQSGYSLVEVLIALAITSVVLLTVVTLFYMGRRNVYSGKQMTYAVSVGTRALEDISQMTMQDVIAAFGITDAGTTLGTVTINNVQYANSAEFDTTQATPPALLTTWKTMTTNLANPTVGVIFTPRAQTGAGTWTTATFMRMRIFIQWDEAQNRRRIAFFDTTKINRQQ